jgi:hypothetical protein
VNVGIITLHENQLFLNFSNFMGTRRALNTRIFAGVTDGGFITGWNVLKKAQVIFDE